MCPERSRRAWEARRPTTASMLVTNSPGRVIAQPAYAPPGLKPVVYFFPLPLPLAASALALAAASAIASLAIRSSAASASGTRPCLR